MDDGIQASVKFGKNVDVSFLNQSPVARQIALILENIGEHWRQGACAIPLPGRVKSPFKLGLIPGGSEAGVKCHPCLRTNSWHFVLPSIGAQILEIQGIGSE
jgi:hypothetical protein